MKTNAKENFRVEGNPSNEIILSVVVYTSGVL